MCALAQTHLCAMDLCARVVACHLDSFLATVDNGAKINMRLCIPINACTVWVFPYIQRSAQSPLQFVSDVCVCDSVVWTQRPPQACLVVWVNAHAPPHMPDTSVLWVGPDATADFAELVLRVPAWISIPVAPHVAAIANSNDGPLLFKADALLPDEVAAWGKIAAAHATRPIIVCTSSRLFALLLQRCLSGKRDVVIVNGNGNVNVRDHTSIQVLIGDHFDDVCAVPRSSLLVLWQLRTCVHISTSFLRRFQWMCNITLRGTMAEEHFVQYSPATRARLLA